jgi:beta-mannosidase
MTVRANAFVRDLTLLVDKLDPDAVVDDALTTLFPGESVTWRITTAADLDLAQVLDPTVLRSANQLR